MNSRIIVASFLTALASDPILAANAADYSGKCGVPTLFAQNGAAKVGGRTVTFDGRKLIVD